MPNKGNCWDVGIDNTDIWHSNLCNIQGTGIMAYNLSGVESANNVYEFTKAVNTMLNGNPAILIMIGTWVVSFSFFIVLGDRTQLDKLDSFIASSFITMVIGVLLMMAQMTIWQVAAVPLGMAILGLLIRGFL